VQEAQGAQDADTSRPTLHASLVMCDDNSINDAGVVDGGIEGDESTILAVASPAPAERRETLLEGQFSDISRENMEVPPELPSFDTERYLQKQRARVYKIQTLKEKIESRSIPSYAEELESETAVDQSALTLAHVSVETLERQQRQIENEQAEAIREERRKQAIRHKLIREKEEDAKDAVHREAEKAAEVLVSSFLHVLDARAELSSIWQAVRRREEMRLLRDRARGRSMRDAMRQAGRKLGAGPFRFPSKEAAMYHGTRRAQQIGEEWNGWRDGRTDGWMQAGEGGCEGGRMGIRNCMCAICVFQRDGERERGGGRGR
jgi:hypothetical protein